MILAWLEGYQAGLDFDPDGNMSTVKWVIIKSKEPHPLKSVWDAAAVILRGSRHGERRAEQTTPELFGSAATARLRAGRKDLKNQLPEFNTLSEEQLRSNKPAVTVSPPPLDYAPISQLREGALCCSGSRLEKARAQTKEETVRLLLKMQTSTVSPVTNTTAPSNTTAVTKTKEQILIQSSGAMIAVIVIGIILILALLLIILKTYNRRTHVARVLGATGSKPRPKSQSTIHSNMPLTPVGGVNSVSGSIFSSIPVSENGFHLPRAELSSAEGSHMDQFSTTSESTAITIHDAPSIGNT